MSVKAYKKRKPKNEELRAIVEFFSKYFKTVVTATKAEEVLTASKKYKNSLILCGSTIPKPTIIYNIVMPDMKTTYISYRISIQGIGVAPIDGTKEIAGCKDINGNIIIPMSNKPESQLSIIEFLKELDIQIPEAIQKWSVKYKGAYRCEYCGTYNTEEYINKCESCGKYYCDYCMDFYYCEVCKRWLCKNCYDALANTAGFVKKNKKIEYYSAICKECTEKLKKKGHKTVRHLRTYILPKGYDIRVVSNNKVFLLKDNKIVKIHRKKVPDRLL